MFKRILLIGFPGAGKSTVANLLSEKLPKYKLISTDAILETALTEVNDGKRTWESFRRKEQALLEDIMRTGFEYIILDCGGGIIEYSECRILLKHWSDSIIIWLDADLETIKRRIAVDVKTRIWSFDVQNPSALYQTYNARRNYYIELSDPGMTIITTKQTPHEIVESIFDSLSKEECSSLPVPMEESVISPEYYTKGKIEVIDFIEDQNLNFNLGNVIKYVSRAGYKDPLKTLEDLNKARWYINREIDRLEGRG